MTLWVTHSALQSDTEPSPSLLSSSLNSLRSEYSSTKGNKTYVGVVTEFGELNVWKLLMWCLLTSNKEVAVGMNDFSMWL